MKSLLGRFSNSAMTLVMLAIFVVLLAIALRYPAQARFTPMLIALPAIALCLLQLFLDARARRGSTGEVDNRSEFEKAQAKVSRIAGRQMDFAVAHVPMPVVAAPELSHEETVRREFILWGYFLGFIAGILLFGFWVAIPVFLVTFLRHQAKSSWRMSLLLGISASIAMFFVFERGLKVQVHRGFVVDYLMDRLAL
jgi:hypothetical protein